MLTHRMLELLHTRLVANAPRQAGSHEYRMGVNDAIAAVQRLVEAGMPRPPTADWTAEPEGPDQTRLAAEYLRLEVTSLLMTVDSILRLRRSGTHRAPGDGTLASLLDAKTHLVQARGALTQTQGSLSG